MKNRSSGILHLILSALVCFPLSLTGQQSIDLFTLSGQYGLPQSYDEDALPGEATEYVGLANLKLPVVLSESNIWYNDLTYTLSYVDNEPVLDAGLADPTRLHGFILQTGLVRRLNDQKAIQLLLTPRFMTDFRNAGADNLQLGGIVLYERRSHHNLLLRYGLMYNDDAFGPMFVPLVYLDWRPRPRWKISGLLPIYGKAGYQLGERFSSGLSFFALVTSYPLGHPDYADDYIERKSIDLTLFGRYRLWGNLHLESRLGYALSREYAQFAGDQQMDLRISIIRIGDERVQQNVNFQDGPIAQLRVVYNLPIE